MKPAHDKRVALVIGGTGPTGTAVCRRLSLSGAEVAVDAREAAEEWRIGLAGSGLNVTTFPADVRDFNDCARLVEAVEASLGPVDILVNVLEHGEAETAFEDMDRIAWERSVTGTVDVLYNVCHQLAERMSSRGYGRIVNVSSVSGRMGRPGRAHHAAASAGIHGFTMALAQELARKGVTVNTVSPGVIEASPGPAPGSTVPAGRAGTPEEIAGVVDFLCSEQAAYLNGADIPVNGGLYMQ